MDTYLERVENSILKDQTIPVYRFGVEQAGVDMDDLLEIASEQLDLDEISLVRPYAICGKYYTHFEFVYNSDYLKEN